MTSIKLPESYLPAMDIAAMDIAAMDIVSGSSEVGMFKFMCSLIRKLVIGSQK